MPTGDGVHPYAAKAIAAELGRLDALPRPHVDGQSYWDQTTFDVACNLIELANSPWSGYGLSDAEHDLRSHAPRDQVWGERHHTKCWESARERVGAHSRPEPGPLERVEVVSTETLAPSGEVENREADEVEISLDRFNLIDWPTLKRTEDVGEEWIAEPLIAAGRMTALYSAPKAGKSLLVLEVVAAVALGLPVLDHPAQAPRVVLYVDFENDPRGDIKPRLEDMGHDLDDLEGRLYVATFPSMAHLDTPQGGQDVLWLAQHLRAELVVIDTVSRTVGGEENDNNTWLNFYRSTGVPLKREGIACLRLDHSGKDAERGMRGGSAKYGDVDAVWRLTAASETVLELQCTDHRMPIETPSFTVVRRTDPLRHEVAGDPFAVAMDAKEQSLIATLDRLQIPQEWGRDRVRKALADAGYKVQNTLLARVIRTRRAVTVATSTDLSGTGSGQLSAPVSEDACPPPPVGGRTADRSEPVRAGRDDDEPDKPMFVVSCKGCYAPTDRDLAHANDGLCDTCKEPA